jgi:hypothetical protein
LTHDAVFQQGGIQGFCDMLNITQEDCQQQVFDEAERIKCHYDPESNKKYSIGIDRVPTLDRPTTAQFQIEFPRYVSSPKIPIDR